jgi:hypothetical protein
LVVKLRTQTRLQDIGKIANICSQEVIVVHNLINAKTEQEVAEMWKVRKVPKNINMDSGSS